jgi:lipopolysaccharide export system protein LptC
LAHVTDLRRGSGPAAGPRGAFGVAQRHSRRVRILRYAVPAVAVLALVALALYALFDPFRARDVSVDVGTLSVAGDTLTMELPRLTGFNKRQQSYNVTAKTAQQKITAPGLIDLTDLKAIISMPDKTTATLTASAGRFDSTAEFLTLRETVRVTSTKGYAANLKSASVDFKAGTVRSKDPVEVELESGLVKAGSLAVEGGGDVITFAGGVSTQFKTKPKEPAAARPAAVGSTQRQGSIQ